MVTYAQLQAESWWGREIVTPELDWLGDELCRRTGQPRTAAGTKGNDVHLSGAHRSQEWILRSRYCTNRRYTVQDGLTATQARHIAGFDFVPGVWGTARNRQLMVEQTKRLMAAMRAGLLPEVDEIYGTTDGRTVTGISYGEPASSDDSHLEHWHLTIDRRHLANRNLMERIVAIALGDDLEDDEMSVSDLLGHRMSSPALGPVYGKERTVADWLKDAAKALRAVDALRAGFDAFAGAEEARDAAHAAQLGGADAVAAIQAARADLVARAEAQHAAEVARLDQLEAKFDRLLTELPDEGPVDAAAIKQAMRELLGELDGATPAAAQG